jgi:two-component system sensor histidine kinase KdpD
MSKIESGYFQLQRQTYDITELFGIAINELKADFNIDHLRVHTADTLPPLFIDIHWFKQAVINVLRNAIQYTPPGSEIFLNAWKDESDAVVIEVLDSGTGVPAQSLEKLFEKFYRVPGTKIGGTGLGLAISKAIVEAHKGLIFAANKEGGGLSVVILMGKKDHD